MCSRSCVAGGIEAPFNAFILPGFAPLCASEIGVSRVWSSGEPVRAPSSLLGRCRVPERQHKRSNHDGGSTNIQSTHSVLESVLLESRQCRHANTVYLFNQNSVSFRVLSGSVIDSSEGSECASVWLCGGE